MSMIVNLGWPIVLTNQHAEVREAITSPLRPAERLMLRTQTGLDKSPGINRTLAVHDRLVCGARKPPDASDQHPVGSGASRH
jgi:hypothetical protein